MAVKVSVLGRNAKLDALETLIGASAVMKLRTGAPPTGIADVDTGTVISTINLPADWMSAAAAGVKSMLGTWQDTSADAAGTIGHYRVYSAGGTVQHLQGTVTATGGGGDLTVDNVVVAAAQNVQITSYTWTEGNA